MSAVTMNHSTTFPFTALEGQEQLQLALLLLAVDPTIGGVMIEGPRGTAKSTSARALADLLPTGQFVNLPLGTTEEQLQGALDLEAALQGSKVQFRPGLLAQAHEGILYVDETNLLPDGLVDLLLDVCASGINRVERDGVSHQHPARVALIGTMNPEEGQLRPQLLDRFGLYVRLPNVPNVAVRKRIVQARMAFDADTHGFMAKHASAQNQLASQLAQARSAVVGIDWSEPVFDHVAQLCHQAQVEGVRADLVMLRAARAHAALQGRVNVTLADVDAVAELALLHRRNPQAPKQQPQGQSAEQRTSEAGQSNDTSAGAPHAQNGTLSHVDGDDEGWGGMVAPTAVAIQTVKQIRPLSPKKA